VPTAGDAFDSWETQVSTRAGVVGAAGLVLYLAVGLLTWPSYLAYLAATAHIRPGLDLPFVSGYAHGFFVSRAICYVVLSLLTLPVPMWLLIRGGKR
jgi:hypothetical protein